ncbi:MAG: ABC transporter ATP-binding protein [Gammaproteobacteria bacterium]|nr:ABC transporter ATP-binding protein [Gammaproteobacteria bacterium]
MGGYLETINLTKSFGANTVVKQLSLTIERGEIFSLLGGSGCGKSTLLRMLAGFETPTSGGIRIEGVEIGVMPPYSRPMNMMFQSYALFPHLNVFDNIAFGLRREGRSRQQITQRVGELLELVQLQGYELRKPSQLSGGQQQRVALARSLARKPAVLLLDEPLGALDKKLRERTQFELTKIIKQIGVTCLMVTHDQEEAMTMSHRIGVMKDGVLLQVGTPTDIYKHPRSLYVADFIGSVNLIEGSIIEVGDKQIIVSTAEGAFNCKADHGHSKSQHVLLGLRPESILINHSQTSDGVNRVRARITESAYIGTHTIIMAQTTNGLIFKVNRSNENEMYLGALNVGDEITLSWTPEATLVLTS